ncbi:MAG: hypothetical protein HYY06_15210 [Deltaproteobacteria bacterium]|nr:hypothetical protein [Deltaproteobacteria bacterium]
MANHLPVDEILTPVRVRIEGVQAPLRLELRQGMGGAALVARLGFLRRGAQVTVDDPTSGPDATARVATIHDVAVAEDSGVPELTIALGPIGVPHEAVRSDERAPRWHLEALAPLLGSATLALLATIALVG